jgi:hypothetical protein
LSLSFFAAPGDQLQLAVIERVVINPRVLDDADGATAGRFSLTPTTSLESLRWRARQAGHPITLEAIHDANAERPFGSSAILGSFVASEPGVAEESEDP